MPALSDLVQRTKQYMYGYTTAQQQFTYITNSILAGDTAFVVNDPTQVSRGIIEVDGSTNNAELINLSSVNRQVGTVSVIPSGRGWAGTTAVAHSANAALENNPIFPQARVIEAINAAIRSVYPQVFAVGTAKITKLSVVFEYQLPANTTEILSCYYQLIGPSKIQVPMMNYQFNGQATTTDFSTGKAVYFGNEPTPGREIFVTYKMEPNELVNWTDDFATVTGLPSSVQDVIIWRACANLAPALDGPRLILDSVESNERAAYMQPGSAAKVSQAFEQMATTRLMMESMKQYNKYPMQVHNAY